MARRVTCAVTSRKTPQAIAVSRRLEHHDDVAGRGMPRRHRCGGEDELPLLVLLGDVRPSAAAVGLLLEAVEADPMIGFASARLTGGDDEQPGAAGRRAAIGRSTSCRAALLAEIPDTYLVADAPGRCLLDQGGRSCANSGTWTAVSQRRRRAVALHEPRPPLRVSDGDLQSCRRRRAVHGDDPVRRPRLPRGTCRRPTACCFASCLPDVERTVASSSEPRTPPSAETRLARALPHAYGARPSLLLDCRNIVAGMNGTAMAALGICGGLHALRSRVGHHAPRLQGSQRLSRAGGVVSRLADRDDAARAPVHGGAPAVAAVAYPGDDRPARRRCLQRLSVPGHDLLGHGVSGAAAPGRHLAIHGRSCRRPHVHLRDTRAIVSAAASAFAPGCASSSPYLSFDPADYVRPDMRVAPPSRMASSSSSATTTTTRTSCRPMELLAAVTTRDASGCQHLLRN